MAPPTLRNPLAARAERRTSRMLTRVGWEPPQTWPVPRPGEPPLVLETRLPAAEFVPVADLPARHRDARASVGTDLMTLANAARRESVFLAAAICSTQADHGVLATMTASLAPRPLPFLGRDGTAASRRARKRVKGMTGRVSVIERQEDDRPGAPLIVQYAIALRYGTLTLTFVAGGPALAGNARRLFQNIVRGCRLGPEPPA
ncbi:MAG TPA: hypothetical protein VGH67_22125 [Solirubrobacteraceae bacterium]